VGVRVLLSGTVVMVLRCRLMRRQLFQSHLVIVLQSILRIVYEDRRTNMHGVGMEKLVTTGSGWYLPGRKSSDRPPARQAFPRPRTGPGTGEGGNREIISGLTARHGEGQLHACQLPTSL
jgi:hypothetical protein